MEVHGSNWRLATPWILKLRCKFFRGVVWEMRDGTFPKFKSLLLEDLDIEDGRSEHIMMPNLESLIVRHCYKLQWIPQQLVFSKLFGILLEDCNPMAVASTRRVHAMRTALGVIQYFGDFNSWESHSKLAIPISRS